MCLNKWGKKANGLESNRIYRTGTTPFSLQQFNGMGFHLMWNWCAGTARGDGCYYLSQVPGGCPDINQCKDVCTPCYRGIGVIVAECVPPTATTLPTWECRCNFTKGAPCPPPLPPMCPKPPQPNNGPGPTPGPYPFEGNWLILNETHAVFHPKGIEPYGLK